MKRWPIYWTVNRFIFLLSLNWNYCHLKNLTDDEQAIIKSFISECKIIDINRGIKDLSIFIRKKYHIKLPDAIIAATTKYMDLPLITADKGFKQLENLSLIFYEI